MFWNDAVGRPIWLAALLGAGFGAAAEIVTGVLGDAVSSGPIVTMLVPAAVGLVAALVIRSGWGAVGVAIGIIVAAQAVASLAIAASPSTTDVVLGIVSALLGYGVGVGVAQQQAMPGFRPPAPADLDRVEADVRLQLRTIDPMAPGSFERATVLLRKINEQAANYGPWMGPRPTGGDIGPPIGLLDLQAELVETARVAALAAGARRVIITSTGMGGGIDVQAIFGDPIAQEESLAIPAQDID